MEAQSAIELMEKIAEVLPQGRNQDVSLIKKMPNLDSLWNLHSSIAREKEYIAEVESQLHEHDGANEF